MFPFTKLFLETFFAQLKCWTKSFWSKINLEFFLGWKVTGREFSGIFIWVPEPRRISASASQSDDSNRRWPMSSSSVINTFSTENLFECNSIKSNAFRWLDRQRCVGWTTLIHSITNIKGMSFIKPNMAHLKYLKWSCPSNKIDLKKFPFPKLWYRGHGADRSERGRV